MLKLLAFVKVNSETSGEQRTFEKWQTRHEELLKHIRRNAGRKSCADDEAEEGDDELADEFSPATLRRCLADNYKMDEIFADTYGDLDTLVQFLGELKGFTSAHDDKLQASGQTAEVDPESEEATRC